MNLPISELMFEFILWSLAACIFMTSIMTITMLFASSFGAADMQDHIAERHGGANRASRRMRLYRFITGRDRTK
jgi:hypothetical protein